MFTLCLYTCVIIIRQEFARICHVKNIHRATEGLHHRYTKKLQTVVNKITRELKPKCTPRDFCPLLAGVLGLGDDVMIVQLC